MALRILKVDDEAVELLVKVVGNMHRKLLADPNHPVYSPYLLPIHSLHEQLQEGLSTELQYARSLKGVDLALAEAEEEKLAKNRELRKKRLEKAGITSREPVADPPKPAKKAKATKKAAKRSAKRASKKVAKKKPSEPIITGPCNVHKDTYGGARSPRKDCPGCWRYYKELHPERYDAAWAKFKELNNS